MCLVIPLLSGESTSELVREITELGAWLIEVYKGSPKCLKDTWIALVGSLSAAANLGDGPLTQAVYKIPLPTSLANNGTWKEQKFKAISPRVETIPAMDNHATDELLYVLVTTLNQDLMTGLNP